MMDVNFWYLLWFGAGLLSGYAAVMGLRGN